MTEEQAQNIALTARSKFDVPDDFTFRRAEKRIIELVDDGQPIRDALPSPGMVRDVVAWVVTLGFDVAEVEFAVDDATGEIVRFRRSRSSLRWINDTKDQA
jgi:hypothetical protein